MLNRRTATGLIGAGLTLAVTRAMAQDAEPVDISIDQRTSRFKPETVTIKVGDTVTWTNPGIVTHTVTFDPHQAKIAANVLLPVGVEPFGSADLEQDGTFTHKFTVAGTYKYVCKYHEDMGMIGTLIVS